VLRLCSPAPPWRWVRAIADKQTLDHLSLADSLRRLSWIYIYNYCNCGLSVIHGTLHKIDTRTPSRRCSRETSWGASPSSKFHEHQINANNTLLLSGIWRAHEAFEVIGIGIGIVIVQTSHNTTYNAYNTYHTYSQTVGSRLGLQL
jgi:hypothetical protein